MAIESACIPLPSEIIMPFSGYLVYTGRFQLVWVATAGAIGCNLGSAVAYWVGAHGGRPLVERFGRYVLLSRHDLDRTTPLLSEIRIDHRVCGAPAAGGADLYRLTRRNRPDAAVALSISTPSSAPGRGVSRWPTSA